MAAPTFVQSLDPAGSKPVATTIRDYGGTDTHSLAIQHFILTDASSDIQATVRSYASSKPVAVALTDGTGAHISNVSVQGSVLATQGGAPWTVVASIPGLTSNGSVFASQVGSWSVLQAGAPWTVVASIPGATSNGSVSATQVGSWAVIQGGTQWTVTASCVGQQTVTASLVGIPTIQIASGGQPLGSVVGSAAVSQVGSWAVIQGGTQWTVTASCVGNQTVTASVTGQVTTTASVVGAVNVTQVTTPFWYVVASVVGGGSAVTVTGSVFAIQQGSYTVTANQGGTWTAVVNSVTMWAGAGDPGSGTLSVRSWASGPLLRISLEQGTLSAGADGKLLDFNNTAIGANVTSNTGAGGAVNVVLVSSGGVRTTVASDALGGLLNVNLARGTINLSGADGAMLDGVDNTIKASVKSYANSKPQTITLVDTTGLAIPFIPMVGSVSATQLGTWSAAVSQVGSWAVIQGGTQWTVTASCIGQQTVTASVTGQVTVTASLIGIPAFQIASGGQPIGSVIGSAAVSQVGSWAVIQGGTQWTVTASCTGQQTVTASLIGIPTVQITSGAQPLGTVVASVIGQTTVTASCIGQQTVTASLIGIPTVVGSFAASQVGSWAVIQGGTQWTVTASVIGQPTMTASLVGVPTVVASVIGQSTVTASVVGIPTFTGSATIVGSVLVTNAKGPTYENHQFTIQGSLFNMSFTNSLGFLHSASCSCTRSAFSRVPLATNVSIRNVSNLATSFRFNTQSGDLVTLDAGEVLAWNFLVTSEMYVTTTSITALRVALI